MRRSIISLLFISIVFSCGYLPKKENVKSEEAIIEMDTDNVEVLTDTIQKIQTDDNRQKLDIDTSVLMKLLKPIDESKFPSYGLVKLKEIDSTIIVDLKYSTTDNFMGIDVYGAFNTAYLQEDVAKKIAL
ncbi:MAG: hypothetical protein MRY83_15900, partial [Flavobacteriales bacterium]|nr:hypothetical protein [Flavobacteriales bacterium]